MFEVEMLGLALDKDWWQSYTASLNLSKMSIVSIR